MILASTSVVFDPVWPWSLPIIGWPGLALVALLLVGLTVLTYLVGQRASIRQFLIVLLLRLAALAIALMLVLRPAVAQREESFTPSKLLILVDYSASMNNKDEFNSKSRWEAAARLLQSNTVKQALKRLQEEQKVEIVFYQGAGDVKPYDPEGKADGKRTDIGLWLTTLKNNHANDPIVRTLILLSDGADNGTTTPALDAVKELRFPVHTIGLGSSKTSADEKDIYFVPDSIQVAPSPVPVKAKFTVEALVNAPGFVDALRPVRLYINDKEVKQQNFVLAQREGNKIKIEADAPAEPGDYKVTLKIDPHPAEVSDQNNDISTYVTVTKDGLSVLWVEGKKRLESTWVIRHVLSHDPKVRVFYTERVNEKQPPPAGQEDWFQFDKQNYDVIVIGDIAASRFSGGDPKVFKQLNKLVKNGTGLLVLGGYESFTKSDWGKYKDFTDMLPVELKEDSPANQVEGAESMRVKPTTEGLDHFVLKLFDDPALNNKTWSTFFRPLDGMTKIGTVKDQAVVLATDGGDPKKPVMAFKMYGGRVVAFGGDTTWKAWYKNKDAVEGYRRFWKKLVYWLANKEKVSEDVWVKLDTRRLPAGNNGTVNIKVGLNPDKSKNYDGVKYEVMVKPPGAKEAVPVGTTPVEKSENFEQAGPFWHTNPPGEYLVTVNAFDKTGKKINTTTAEARFLTYAQDLETLRPAADHGFLAKLAAARGGQFRLAGEAELAELLNQMAQKSALLNQSQKVVWPDWNRDPVSTAPADQVAGLISSGIFVFFLLFCSLLCLEWLLRRRWNMV